MIKIVVVDNDDEQKEDDEEEAEEEILFASYFHSQTSRWRLGSLFLSFASGRDKNVRSLAHTRKNTSNAFDGADEGTNIHYAHGLHAKYPLYIFVEPTSTSSGIKNRESKKKKSNWNDIFKRIQFNFKLNYLFANFIESILFIPHTRTS